MIHLLFYCKPIPNSIGGHYNILCNLSGVTNINTTSVEENDAGRH